MANLIGPDVSFYQDEPGTPQGINFLKMKQQAGYVIIRSGQNTWIDSDFKTNWRDAKAAGLPRGSYWFYDSRFEPKKQAELWFSVFEGDFGELPLFADFEEAYGGQYTGWRHWRTFLDRLKALTGDREIAIYTAYFYWIRNAPSATLDPTNLAYFHQYPLWIANYGVAKPSVPKPWTADEWLFWQYTDSGDGKAFGVESSRIDLNYFNGDLAAFKLRFKTGSTPPPPPPQGPVWYKVTAAEGLNVRTGPGTSFDPPIGLLKRDEVVEGLATSADGGWAQIKRASDNLTGWSSLQFLVITSAPDIPPPPPPPPPPSAWYKVVNASALNVREGPSTEFKSVGLLHRNEVVQRLATSPDGAWLQIKRPSDGLTGWSSKTYLAETTAPPPAEEPKENWYQVTATGLNVRERPTVSSKSLGFLSRNDGVKELEISADGTWRKIERVDGLTGWCSGEFLKNLGKTPVAITQKLFSGVVYHRKTRLTPKRMVSHALVVDLQAAAFEFLITPPIRDKEPFLCTRTTTGFLEKYQLHMAINGDGFYYLDPATYNPQDYCADGGEPIRLVGFASSRGKQYSAKAPGRPILYISQKNVITVDKPASTIFNAISGDRMLVTKGVKVANLESTSMDPRTAIGVNQNGRWLVLIVVDGREFSEGATFPDLADLLLSHGVYTGMSLDGGGSSTLAIKGIDGKPRAVSKLFDEGVPGQERRVANHIGIYIKK
ncbi:MAG TPA: SH3 domain-containing protein [Anaerolineales bacterium]|nr:SH3 domain-containing protein [Anaerolineales bacterium]